MIINSQKKKWLQQWFKKRIQQQFTKNSYNNKILTTIHANLKFNIRCCANVVQCLLSMSCPFVRFSKRGNNGLHLFEHFGQVCLYKIITLYLQIIWKRLFFFVKYAQFELRKKKQNQQFLHFRHQMFPSGIPSAVSQVIYQWEHHLQTPLVYGQMISSSGEYDRGAQEQPLRVPSEPANARQFSVPCIHHAGIDSSLVESNWLSYCLTSDSWLAVYD